MVGKQLCDEALASAYNKRAETRSSMPESSLDFYTIEHVVNWSYLSGERGSSISNHATSKNHQISVSCADWPEQSLWSIMTPGRSVIIRAACLRDNGLYSCSGQSPSPPGRAHIPELECYDSGQHKIRIQAIQRDSDVSCIAGH
jgi:hypothetical protein